MIIDSLDITFYAIFRFFILQKKLQNIFNTPQPVVDSKIKLFDEAWVCDRCEITTEILYCICHTIKLVLILILVIILSSSWELEPLTEPA